VALPLDAVVAGRPTEAGWPAVPGWLWRLLSVAVVALAWEFAGRVPISFAFPTFSATMAALFDLVVSGELPRAYLSTLQPLMIGVVISAMAGVGLGVAMGLSRGLEWLGAPLFTVLQAAPMAALIPLITFVYGIGLTSKVIAVCILAMPVIVLNSFGAVRNASPSLIQMCRSFLGTRWQQIAKVIVPDAAPVIFAGLRLGVAAGFIGVVLAELLITPTGIGDLITYYRSMADYPQMYATILSIIVFAAVAVELLGQVEMRLFRPERRGR
jgi:ABC-type nitrate/sulfonate/bicarbonate transport system permease component